VKGQFNSKMMDFFSRSLRILQKKMKRKTWNLVIN